MESFVDIRLIRELVTAPAARELNADLWERARFAQNWLRTNPTQLESYEGPLFELAATPGQWGAFCSLESYLVGLLLEDLDIDSTTQRRWITKTLDVLLSVREPLVRHSLMDGINWFGMALRNRSPRNRLTIGLLLIESDRRYGPTCADHARPIWDSRRRCHGSRRRRY